MFRILGISYVGWICAWWSTISIWCVYVLDMGVCASSGSVGFWPIIPAALRSLLRSHAHIWHSFPDMITIHLPLWVWLYGIFPSFPSGTGATFQNWTTSPPPPPPQLSPHPTPTPSSPPTLLSPYPTPTPPSSRFLLPWNWNPLVQPFFPPESAVCVCRHDWVIWQRHLFNDLPPGWGRKGKGGVVCCGGRVGGYMRKEGAMKFYLCSARFLPSFYLSSIFSWRNLTRGINCWLLHSHSWSSYNFSGNFKGSLCDRLVYLCFVPHAVQYLRCDFDSLLQQLPQPMLTNIMKAPEVRICPPIPRSAGTVGSISILVIFFFFFKIRNWVSKAAEVQQQWRNCSFLCPMLCKMKWCGEYRML